MSETVSNKTLVVLLVVAIGISVLGIWVSVSKTAGLTGAQTAQEQQGTATVTISGVASIVLNDATITYDLTFLQNATTCTYVTNQTDLNNVGCNVSVVDSMELENTGNVNVNINATSSLSPDGVFINATSATQYLYAVDTSGESGSCDTPSVSGVVLTNTSESLLCDVLHFGDAADSLTIYHGATTTTDAVGGTAQTITFYATQV